MGKASASTTMTTTTTTTEGGEILRRKKEMWRSYSYEFSEDMKKLLGVRLATAQAQQVAGAGETTTKRKRKTKVMKQRVPREVIDSMIATPHPIIGKLLTDDQLAERDECFREAYAKCKVRSEKARAYYQAIIDQYNAKGYAEDEYEVTDDDEETVEN